MTNESKKDPFKIEQCTTTQVYQFFQAPKSDDKFLFIVQAPGSDFLSCYQTCFRLTPFLGNQATYHMIFLWKGYFKRAISSESCFSPDSPSQTDIRWTEEARNSLKQLILCCCFSHSLPISTLVFVTEINVLIGTVSPKPP